MTPLSRRKVETGFQSTEAHQLLEYLNNIQQCQLQMICTRVCILVIKTSYCVTNFS